MHRHMGPSHMLHRPECRCWEACGFRGFRRLGGRRIKHKLVIFMLSASQYPSQFFPSASHKLPYFPCSCRRERPYRKLGNQNIFFCKITKEKKNPQKLPLAVPSILVFLPPHFLEGGKQEILTPPPFMIVTERP